MEKRSSFSYQFDVDIAKSVGVDVDDSFLVVNGTIHTQNGTGRQMSTLSPLFDDWISGYDKEHPILDVGCAYGINSLTAAVKHESDVVAVDIAQSHLEYVKKAALKLSSLYINTPPLKVDVKLTSLPNLRELFPPSSSPPSSSSSESQKQLLLFSSILCAEVIHFLTPEEVKQAFQSFHNLLIPGGRLSITCASIYAFQHIYPRMTKEIIRRQESRTTFSPGYFSKEELARIRSLRQSDDRRRSNSTNSTNANIGSSDRKSKYVGADSQPQSFHSYTMTELAMLAEESGFVVKSLVCKAHPGYVTSSTALQHDDSTLMMVAHKRKSGML